MYRSNTAFSDTKIGTASKSSDTSYVNYASSLMDVQQEICKCFSMSTVGYTEVMSEMKCLMAWRTSANPDVSAAVLVVLRRSL